MPSTAGRIFCSTLAAASFAVFALSLLAAAVLDTPGGPRVATTARPLTRPVVGMNINVYYAPDMSAYRGAIDGIAGLGCNTVQVVTPVFVENGASSRIERLVGPDRGPSREQVLELLRYGKGRGLRVHLMPQVNLYAPRGNEWRGKISPDDWNAWWASYQEAMLQWAGLAAEADADLLVVGCELVSTQGPEHEARWRSLVAACRERFDGHLTYSTNWDRYDRVLFWDALDAVGINGYWDLTVAAVDPSRPTDAELVARWRGIRDRLLAYAEAEGRPLLLTEVGYPTLPTGLKQPWNYLASGRNEGVATQAAGYRAFIAAWDEAIAPPRIAELRDPRVAGVCFYKWDIYQGGDPKLDSHYGVADRPAQGLLRAWLRRP